MSTAVAVSFWALAVACAATALRAAHPDGLEGPPRPRPATVTLWLLVAVPSVLQTCVPGLLAALERDWRLVAGGQVWRLATSVVVQDGGVAGTVFNLFALAVVAVAAQEYWSASRTWATFWLGAVAANLVVGPVLEPVGAGSSMATFALGGALVTNALLGRTRSHAVPAALVALACVAVVAAGRDYHALPCLLGLAVGTVPPHGPRGLSRRGSRPRGSSDGR
ncbi:rhomboid family intramembrane serine protease [Ornithinimicrobium avium]|uniref:Rhomboid family intramembrane serine protease n=1 Tax=Ornithinimicrobium avium TaxID=2283195 RepID=A0A345NKY6_9MICO|nr:rhomboid family intramembrane serine protease [Ornithinimicrobium avium]AXH95694.1 rhomboid family intramembrane serine protease [Ornithinimicrobium avium]